MIEGGRGVLQRELGRLFGEGTLPLTDGQLLERYLQSGDAAAFEALVRKHGPMVLSLCRRYLRDETDVEDAFQATFLVLVRKAASIRRRQLLSSWLHGVAYKVSMRARSHQRRWRSQAAEGLDLLESPVDEAPTVEIAEIGQVLDQELGRLPEKYRVPLVLCYLNDRTHEQAAAELSWPVGTVRSRLARGRELLRGRLARRGYAPSAAILGPLSDLPSRPFTSTIPPALVRATVATAVRVLPAASAGAVAGIGAGATTLFPTCSGSATALAQGVISTMALTQMKMIGASLVAAGMLAGGAGAGAWALASTGAGEQADKPVAKPADKLPDRPATPAAPDAIPSALEAQLSVLERKLDLLLQQRETPRDTGPPRPDNAGPAGPMIPSSADSVNPLPLLRPHPDANLQASGNAQVVPSPKLDREDEELIPSRSGRSTAPSVHDRSSVRELAAQLQIAIRRRERLMVMFKQGLVDRDQLEFSTDEIRLLEGRLRGMEDDLADEQDLLKAERARKQAELKLVQAQSERDAERAHGAGRTDARPRAATPELRIAWAQVEGKRGELEEVELRIAHVEKRRTRIRQVLTMVEKTVPDRYEPKN